MRNRLQSTLLTHLVNSDLPCILVLTLWQLKNIKSDLKKKKKSMPESASGSLSLTRRAQGQKE